MTHTNVNPSVIWSHSGDWTGGPAVFYSCASPGRASYLMASLVVAPSHRLTSTIHVRFMFVTPRWQTNGWGVVSFCPSWWPVLKGAAWWTKPAGWWNKDNGHYLLTTSRNCQMSSDLPTGVLCFSSPAAPRLRRGCALHLLCRRVASISKFSVSTMLSFKWRRIIWRARNRKCS